MSITTDIVSEMTNIREWNNAVDNRKTITDSPAVYAILLADAFPRLKGDTRILYIGHTKRLGGDSDRARLYAYKYPSGPHGKQIRSRVNELIAAGSIITFHWKYFQHKLDARNRENELLKQHLAEHMELPPFNGKV